MATRLPSAIGENSGYTSRRCVQHWEVGGYAPINRSASSLITWRGYGRRCAWLWLVSAFPSRIAVPSWQVPNIDSICSLWVSQVWFPQISERKDVYVHEFPYRDGRHRFQHSGQILGKVPLLSEQSRHLLWKFLHYRWHCCTYHGITLFSFEQSGEICSPQRCVPWLRSEVQRRRFESPLKSAPATWKGSST